MFSVVSLCVSKISFTTFQLCPSVTLCLLLLSYSSRSTSLCISCISGTVRRNAFSHPKGGSIGSRGIRTLAPLTIKVKLQNYTKKETSEDRRESIFKHNPLKMTFLAKLPELIQKRHTGKHANTLTHTLQLFKLGSSWLVGQ